MKKVFKNLGVLALALALSLGVVASFTRAELTMDDLAVTSNGTLTLTGAADSAVNLGTTATTGAINIGGTLQTGAINIGNSTGVNSVNIGGATSTTNIGGLLNVTGTLDAAGGVKFSDGKTQTLSGMEFLGSKKLTAGAATTGTLTIPSRDLLVILVFVAAYGASPNPAGDIASLRFNGDSGNNYWSRHLYTAAGEVGWINQEFTATNLIRLAETPSRLSRNIIVQIGNIATRTKTVNIKNQTGTNNASLAGDVDLGGGEWVNTVSQITSIEMLTPDGNNMGAGTGFAVYGVNF